MASDWNLKKTLEMTFLYIDKITFLYIDKITFLYIDKW